jgi:hypothetical protein
MVKKKASKTDAFFTYEWQTIISVGEINYRPAGAQR